MRKRNTRGIAGKAGGEVVHCFDNGWTMVRLRTADELDAESAQMQHCVGHGSYDLGVFSGTLGIYSLRDPNGKSHVTVEVDHESGDRVCQIKGKQNDIPKLGYFTMVAEWIDGKGLRLEETCADYPEEYQADNDGRLVDIRTLSEGTVFNGRMRLTLKPDVTILPLPKNMTIRGDLTIRGTDKNELVLPEGLVVEKDFYVDGITVNLDVLPGQSAYIERCEIAHLPARIRQTTTILSSNFIDAFEQGNPIVFDETVCLYQCIMTSEAFSRMSFEGSLSVERMSGPDGLIGLKGLEVKKDFNISTSTLDIETGHLVVGGSFTMDRSRFLRYPSAIHVGRNFHAHLSEILSLPEDLYVGGELRIDTEERLETIPETAVLKGDIVLTRTNARLGARDRYHGHLFVTECDGFRLPDNTRIAGSLNIFGGDCATLPEGLVVGQSLLIERCPIDRIPETTKIGECLALSRSMVRTLPPGMDIPANLDISKLPYFELPEGIVIGGTLIADEAGIVSLPTDIRVRSIVAIDSGLTELPEGLYVDGDLILVGSPISVLPENLSVRGRVDLRRTLIEFIPSSAAVDGVLLVEPGVAVLPDEIRYSRSHCRL